MRVLHIFVKQKLFSPDSFCRRDGVEAWAEIRPTLGYDPPKQPLRPWRRQVVHGTAAPGALTRQSHLFRVATKVPNVSPNKL